MNTFGRIFRLSIFGESHGPEVGILIDGCPAGLALHEEDLQVDLERRRGGSRPGTTTRQETDIPQFRSGVVSGITTGSPICLVFPNRDVKSADYEKLKDTPRPGHADLVAQQKFGKFTDLRGGGHFSGRLTAPLVAAGVIGKKLLGNTRIQAKLIEVGGSQDIEAKIEEAMAAGDSYGGLIECSIDGLVPGLGEPFFDSVESLLSQIIFSIPAIKGIEFGAGFKAATMKGSECNDAILDENGRTGTNWSGGINGGLTNGNTVNFRVAVKPTSSIKRKQKTINLENSEAKEISIEGRHDACIALRVPVVVEAAAAIVFTDLMLLEQRIPRILCQ